MQLGSEYRHVLSSMGPTHAIKLGYYPRGIINLHDKAGH